MLVFVAVAAGTGAFTTGDQIDDGEEVYLDTIDGSPNSDAYAQLSAGELRVDVDRSNRQARTWIDDVFQMGYAGDTSAEVWIEHGSSGVTFYDSSDRSEIESPGSNVSLDPGESVDVGMLLDVDTGSTLLENVTVFARIQDTQEDGGDDPVQGGGGDEDDVDLSSEGVYITEELEDDADVEVEDDTVEIDLGDVSVSVEEPRFRYGLTLRPDAIVAGESAAVEVNVDNVGGVGGSADVEVRVDGSVVQTDELYVEQDEGGRRSYVLGFDEPGEYQVSVGNETQVLVVHERGLMNQAALVLDAVTPSPTRAPWASLVVAAAVTFTALFLMTRRRREDE